MPEKLQELRREIQKLDTEIVRLIDRRMSIVRQIANLKKGTGLPILDAAREDAVFTHVVNQPHDEIGTDNLKLFYQTILEISRRIQKEILDESTVKQPHGK
jgi:monofunctional chorismate mutase